MAIPRLLLLESLLELGKPGLAGLLLCLAALVYGVTDLLPLGEEMDHLRHRAVRAEAALARLPAGGDAPSGEAGGGPEPSSPHLPAQAELTRWIERIYDVAAGENLALNRGEYTLATVADTRLVRYQIVLPVRGDYLRIRRFTASAQAAVPGLGLEELNLQRRDIGESQVEALIRFSLYLARP